MLKESIERLGALVEGVEPMPSQSEIKMKEATNDLLRSTVALVLEQSPAGMSAQELGNAMIVGLEEAAEEAGADANELVEAFLSWNKDLGESAKILSESLKE